MKNYSAIVSYTLWNFPLVLHCPKLKIQYYYCCNVISMKMCDNDTHTYCINIIKVLCSCTLNDTSICSFCWKIGSLWLLLRQFRTAIVQLGGHNMILYIYCSTFSTSSIEKCRKLLFFIHIEFVIFDCHWSVFDLTIELKFFFLFF